MASAGALIGLGLTGARHRSRLMVPLSGGVLLGVPLFSLLPELAPQLGWAASLAWFAGGYAILFAVGRTIYPVCPACSRGHDHASCSSVLHGFAAPLIAAAALHSLLDGWSIATSEWGTPGLRLAIPLAVALHKAPEGIALGAILRAAMPSRAAAFAWCLAAQSTTVAGAALGSWAAPLIGPAWLLYPLALAGGFFCYLGFHAVHEEWQSRGAAPSLGPAAAGLMGAAAFQHTLRVFLR